MKKFIVTTELGEVEVYEPSVIHVLNAIIELLETSPNMEHNKLLKIEEVNV